MWAVAFWLQVALAVLLLVTMDLDLGGGVVRRALNALTDFYEAIGFGTLPVGLLLATIVLFVFWRRA